MPQQALSEAHNFLFEERQRLLKLTAENDELRLQELEDRKRIQTLLAMTQTYDQNFLNNHCVNAAAASSAAGPGWQSPAVGADGMPRFASTLNSDFLLLKIESLQAQLNEAKALAAERVAALLEDRRIRAQEEDGHRAHMAQQVNV